MTVYRYTSIETRAFDLEQDDRGVREVRLYCFIADKPNSSPALNSRETKSEYLQDFLLFQ